MRKLLYLLIVLILAPVIWLVVNKPTFETTPKSPTAKSVEKFAEIKTPFRHIWQQPAHPFTGAAIIDINGDGKMEIFVGGGRDQSDMLLRYNNGALIDVTEGSGLSDDINATHGMASSDIDLDGDVDLLVARENAVTLYLNDGGLFKAQKIPLALDKDAVPLSVAIADVNKDGLPDIYVSAFVSFEAFKAATFNNPDHAKKNIMLINKGNLEFEDQTSLMGTAGINNTFHSLFVDLDRNGSLELILSQNTGEVEIFTPDIKGRYKSVPTKSGFGFWMGLAIGDYDKDGDEDIFASNVGTSIPAFLTKGDLKPEQKHNIGWGLFKTGANLNFTDVTTESKIDRFGFSWGAQFEDLDLDGELDLIVAQNYIKWFLHDWIPLDGKALLQNKTDDGRVFYQNDSLGLQNPHFAQSPVIADINSDGRPDVLWLNMDGPLRAFINKSRNNFISFSVPDNARTLGAIVTVEMDDGTKMQRQVIASTGLMTDTTPKLYFGLGPSKRSVKRVDIKTLRGGLSVLYDPEINKIHKLQIQN